METFWNTFVNGCISVAWKLVLSAVVFFVGRFLIKFLVKHFPNDKKYHKLDPTAKLFIENFIKIALYCVLAITIVAIMGIPMASVVALFASAGAAIALAIQGSFSNMMSGIMLLVFKPVSVGETIKVGDSMGVVNEVGIFYTRIKTFDNVTISIPNSTMTSSTITNYSREENRRVDISFDISYDSDITTATKVIMEVIDASPDALKDPAPSVAVTDLKDSSVVFTVRVWCNASKFGALKNYLYIKGKEEFAKAGIVIPFNQLDVTIKNEYK